MNSYVNRRKDDKTADLPLAPSGDHATTVADTMARYAQVSQTYDKDLDKDESQYRGFELRKRLIKQAEGHVLEVGVGTSRNLAYYMRPKVQSLTLVDNTPEMLQCALAKHVQLYEIAKVPGLLLESSEDHRALIRGAHMLAAFPLPVRQLFTDARTTELPHAPAGASLSALTGLPWARDVSRANTIPTALLHADAHKLDMLPDDTFDTVVECFGLCSYADPVAVLQELQRVCRPDGRMLLLEHGRGDGVLINSVIQLTNESHKRHWGCDRSKDIMALVRTSGLRVVDRQTHHGGTTYVVVGKPARK
jgi:methyltransferase OMS1